MVLKTNPQDDQTLLRWDGPVGYSPVVPLANVRWYSSVKLVLGWPLAFLLFILALPVICLMAALVKLTSRGPVFYSQMRQGRDGHAYRLWKIRTMRVDSEREGAQWAKENDPRATPIGRFLRKTHLDELPQLWNVLRGEMCLVGPRPERPIIAERLECRVPHYRERLLVRPGLTGLAQVHLPADTDLNSVRRKLAHDLYYIGHMNPWLDFRLLVCTGLYLFRVPFHVSAWLLGVPKGQRVESMFPLLQVQMDTPAPHFGPYGEFVMRSDDTVVENVPDSPSGDLGPLEAGRTHVSIIVPCFNEEEALEPLARMMQSVEQHLADQYDLHWLMVDDGSSDGTLAEMKQRFADLPNVRVLSHEENRGLSAAISTGLDAAHTEIVCSIDADCTYDPHRLKEMLPLLTADVALVTASPYHSEGRVLNVPRWRLFLSRGASWLYRRVLRSKLKTYTSCFRVYRRSAVTAIELSEDGFEGVAELLARMDLHGHRIVEFPTTLSTRRVGTSKMRVFRSITGHLRLLAWIGWQRLWRRGTLSTPPSPSVSTSKATSQERTTV
jgi:lipopolysaccharide/colanic/teichoic acid biosynthesis glycosyltransferase